MAKRIARLRQQYANTGCTEIELPGDLLWLHRGDRPQVKNTGQALVGLISQYVVDLIGEQARCDQAIGLCCLVRVSSQLQWFERARFELHPENLPPYDLLLGRLGHDIRVTGGAIPATDPGGVQGTPAGKICLTPTEAELARLINDYRVANGLHRVPIACSLTRVAQLHVHDLHENRPDTGTDPRGQECNLHSWSAKGAWSPVCYTSDHAYAEKMWNKPREITANVYSGKGYEIAYGAFGTRATAQDALDGWKHSPGHNAVILQQNSWKRLKWSAMGIGIYQGYAVVWFGDTGDPQGEVASCQP